MFADLFGFGGFGGRRRRRRRRRACWSSGFSPTQARVPRLEYTTHVTLDRETAENAGKIYELLPKRDCGACGFDSCYDCAVAIASRKAPPDACRIVGKKIKPEVEKMLEG